MIRRIRGFFSFNQEEKWLNRMTSKGLTLNRVDFISYNFEETPSDNFRIRMFPAYNGFTKFCNTPEFIMILNSGYQVISENIDNYYFRKQVSNDMDTDCFDEPMIALKKNKSLLLSNICYFITFMLLPSGLLLSFHGDIANVDIEQLIELCIIGLFFIYAIFCAYKAVCNIAQIIALQKSWKSVS